MKLPRQLEIDGVDADVMAVIDSNQVELYDGAETTIPRLKLTTELRKNIFYAKSLRELAVGFENIEGILANELKGLQKSGAENSRISRLVIVSNDGSPRFYRELEFMLKKHGERLMVCRLDIDSKLLAEVLAMKGRAVKAVLISRKNSLVNVLKSMA